VNIVEKIANFLATKPSQDEFDEWVELNERELSDLIYNASGKDLNNMRFDDFFFKEVMPSALYRAFQKSGEPTSNFGLFLNLLAIAAEKMAQVKLYGFAQTLEVDLPLSPAKYRLKALLEFSAVDDIRYDYLKKFPIVLEHLKNSISSSEDNNMRLLMDVLVHYFNEAQNTLIEHNLSNTFDQVRARFQDEDLIAGYSFLNHTFLSALLTGKDPFKLLNQSVARTRLEPSPIMGDLFRGINREYFGHPDIDHDRGSIFGFGKMAILNDIIVRGRGDFRTPYKHVTADNKVLLYCFYNMKKHFFTSYAVFQVVIDSLKNVFTQKDYPPTFIDLGCGPMTSGLALADILYEKTGSPVEMTYIGIDIANSMLKRASSFQGENFFSPKSKFLYFNSWNDLRAEDLRSTAGPNTPIVINASYLFASDSLDATDLAQFVMRTGRIYKNVYFIFQNPLSEERNVKYDLFKANLSYELIHPGNELILYKPSAKNDAEEYVYYEILKIK
jgi:hypothetical protein